MRIEGSGEVLKVKRGIIYLHYKKGLRNAKAFLTFPNVKMITNDNLFMINDDIFTCKTAKEQR